VTTAALRGAACLALVAALSGCAAPESSLPSADPTARPPQPAAPVARAPERLGPVELTARAPQPAMAPRFRLADPCVDRDIPARMATDVTLTVLDRTYSLAADYVPPDLVAAETAGFIGASADKLVREIVLADLARMREAWEAEGLDIEIESAYRSFASQAATFDAWVARLGYAAALVRTARPGHSEHQLGTALDVTSEGWSGRLGDWAIESAEGAWMAAHAWEYGFVMSYPADAIAATCFGYEPWHYRWIGVDAAAEHRASGLALREYLERHAS
jgi:D-alanyl-D-alanine carboxypeptidase